MAARGIVLSLSITGALCESAANTMALTQTNQRYLPELPLSKGDGSIWILFACSLHKTSARQPPSQKQLSKHFQKEQKGAKKSDVDAPAFPAHSLLLLFAPFLVKSARRCSFSLPHYARYVMALEIYDRVVKQWN
jgi:hypothetical protein